MSFAFQATADFHGRIEFQNAMSRLRKAANDGMVDPKYGTLPYQAAKLAEHCMKLTPPKSEAQGKKRVEKDVRKIFHPVDPEELSDNWLKKVVYNSDTKSWSGFASKVGGGPFAQTEAVKPSTALHYANRDRRGRAKSTKFVTLWRERGALNELIARKKRNVGMAKAGWFPAVKGFQEIMVTEWVSKHGETQGSYAFSPHASNPFVEFRNTSQWAKYHDQAERVARSSLRSRTTAMQTYFAKQMELAAKKTGAEVTSK